MSLALLGSALVPAALSLLVALRTPLRRAAMWAVPAATLPALALALRPGGVETGVFPALLLGTRVGLDAIGQPFLLFTAMLWSVGGAYALAYHAADPKRHRFVAFFLLTAAGNLGLIVAQDLITFYVSFAVMTFGAYPLVVHTGEASALRAGRVYVALAVVGEGLLLAGLLLAAFPAASLGVADVAAAAAASPHRNLIVLLLLSGFGIKAGAVPLHVWLPLAHPVAPTAASAVLSGAMIKAGLLGWVRFLPLGEAALPGWGTAVIALGLAAAFFGVLVGVTQDDAKTALAYSSISQMGIINVAVGVGLTAPAALPTALAACTVYAVHHGLGKGALFLGVGVAAAARSSRWAWRLALAGLAFAGLAVAGAPFTSGMVAKGYLKQAAAASPAAWPEALDLLLPLAAVGTTLLMGRFLLLVWGAGRPEGEETEGSGAPSHGRGAAGLWGPWVVLLAAVAAVVWIVPGWYGLDVDPPGLPYPGVLWVALWPVAAGILLTGLVWAVHRRLGMRPGRYRVSPGDLLIPAEAGVSRVRGAWRRLVEARGSGDPVEPVAARWYGIYPRDNGAGRLRRAEGRLTRWTPAGLLAVFLVVVLFGLLTL